jgi:hypothetical protein
VPYTTASAATPMTPSATVGSPAKKVYAFAVNHSRATRVDSPAVAASLLSSRSRSTAAQSTPVAMSAAIPGYAIARVRRLPTPDLAAAIVPDVLATFLPRVAALPGYAGYIFSAHVTDPTATISLMLLADEATAAAADQVAREYAASLDPRFVTETPVTDQGPLRIYQTTVRSAAELPPFLNGCVFTMRNRRNAPGADIEAVIARNTNDLTPRLAAMPGFVLYAWLQTADGRTAINIWETPDQRAAGNEVIAAWVAANTAATTTGPPVVNDGVVVYADIPGFI